VLCVLGRVHSAVAFSYVTVRIFEGSNLFPALHFPRTDAAKCDTHFYILFQLGNISLEDFSHRVIDTVLYRARLSGFIYLLFTPGRTLPGGDQQDQRTGGRDLLFYYLLWAFMPTTRAWTSGGAIQRLFGGYRRRTITGGRSCWRDASQSADAFFIYLVTSII